MPRQLSLSLLGLAALLLAGCGGSKSTPTSPSPSPGPPAAGTAVIYAAVGASDAMGIGASVPCMLLTQCPNGTGYVPDIVRQLQAAGHPTVTLTNLGIPAAVIGPDIQAIGFSIGRTRTDLPGNFIEEEMPFVPRDATLVTIFAGGNDVRVIVDAINAGKGGGDPAGYADTQVRAFAADYQTLVSGIRSRAPNARIVVANLPNFAGVPYTSGYSTTAKQLVQKISVAFTTQAINPFVSQSIPVVDLMCDARSYQGGTYSSDGFHPNDNGYAFIASEFMKAITSAAYPAPQGSCAQMTLVPPM